VQGALKEDFREQKFREKVNKAVAVRSPAGINGADVETPWV
jgi:hypothetical protein